MNDQLRKLPSVDALLKRAPIRERAAVFGRAPVLYSVREALSDARSRIREGAPCLSDEELERDVDRRLCAIGAATLKQVINATGIVLHTNLGRAVLGKKVLEDIAPIVSGYSNIEFDCESASRGNRHVHITALLRYLTGAQDALVVNNNAAGIILALSTLAKDREAVISRGELIEIGGEFRIPEIMASSGALMKEVGATNRTRLKDYEEAISDRTACVFKAHKSNYSMSGFVEEVGVRELAEFSKRRGLTFIYDIGSGLLRKPAGLPLDREPDVAGSLAAGADLVLFSADKLLGGPQAGVIAGKRELIGRLAKAPLMRALRVGKLTLAALSSACRSYLDDEKLLSENPVFFALSRRPEDILGSAGRMRALLQSRGVASTVVAVEGRCGGGTLPEVRLPSHAVKLEAAGKTAAERSGFSERAFRRLLRLPRPVLGILREGEVLFDLRTIDENDMEYVADAIKGVVS